jgi:hypothetical protein
MGLKPFCSIVISVFLVIYIWNAYLTYSTAIYCMFFTFVEIINALPSVLWPRCTHLFFLTKISNFEYKIDINRLLRMSIFVTP